MRLKFRQFAGEYPRYNATALPDSGAAEAVNCRFEAGVIQPLYGMTSVATLALTGHSIAAIHLWSVGGSDYWLRFQDAVSVIRSPIADDSYSRIYWSGDSRMGGALCYSYTPAVSSGGGTEYPNYYYKLGIPKPTTAITASLTSGTTEGVATEARAYVYTYVSKLGEAGNLGGESAPSPPSNILICPAGGATVALSGLVVDVSASTGREIEKFRIYRVATGSSGNAEYLFVAEIATDYDLPYEDTLDTSELSEALPSVNWTAPRDNMTSLGLTAFGVAYAATGKIVCFSEPFIPYAWPRDYELTCDNDVVAIGHYDSYIIVGTKGRPVMITGIDPASMSQQELPIIEACVSARSMVSMGSYAIYASPNGLVMASGSSARLITEGVITSREWALMTPTSIHAYQHRGKYLFFWYTDSNNKGGVIFDPARPGDGLIRINQYYVAGYRDTQNDILYLIDSNKALVKFDANSAAPLSHAWKSKTVSLDRPGCFTAARVLADSYASLTLTVTADGSTWHTQTITSAAPIRMPRAGRKRAWSVKVAGTDAVREIAIAETVTELQA
jgi:hypothetical protein